MSKTTRKNSGGDLKFRREPPMRGNAIAARKARDELASQIGAVYSKNPAPVRPQLTPGPVAASVRDTSPQRPHLAAREPPKDALRLNEEAPHCKSRPESSKGGNGGSRPFVPWCSKGKGG